MVEPSFALRGAALALALLELRAALAALAGQATEPYNGLSTQLWLRLGGDAMDRGPLLLSISLLLFTAWSLWRLAQPQHIDQPPAPAGAGDRWIAREAPEVWASDGLRQRVATQSLRVPSASVCLPMRHPVRVISLRSRRDARKLPSADDRRWPGLAKAAVKLAAANQSSKAGQQGKF